MASTAKQRSNSKSPEKYYMCWMEYADLVTILSQKIRECKGLKLAGVYGVPRGGVIPAVMLAHALGVNYYTDIDSWLEGKVLKILPAKKKLLIVDDISDTGTTFKKILKRLTDAAAKDCVTASLYCHKKSKYHPDFYVRDNDKWIVFPYEKD